MKITIAKKQINLESALIALAFFGIMGFVFYIYSIDFSLLAIMLILFIYARFFRKIETLPSYLDLSILTAVAVLIPLLIITTF